MVVFPNVPETPLIRPIIQHMSPFQHKPLAFVYLFLTEVFTAFSFITFPLRNNSRQLETTVHSNLVNCLVLVLGCLPGLCHKPQIHILMLFNNKSSQPNCGIALHVFFIHKFPYRICVMMDMRYKILESYVASTRPKEVIFGISLSYYSLLLSLSKSFPQKLTQPCILPELDLYTSFFKNKMCY